MSDMLLEFSLKTTSNQTFENDRSMPATCFPIQSVFKDEENSIFLGNLVGLAVPRFEAN